MNIDESILSKLTDEQKKKVEAAKTPEELLAIAKETGYELCPADRNRRRGAAPDELEAVSGGYSWKVCKRYDCNVEN